MVALDAPRHVSAPTTTTSAPPATTSTTAPSPVTTIPPPPPTTTTPPPVVVQPASGGDGCLGWRDEISIHFPADQVPTACRVMDCETGGTGDPTIHNATSSASGLFQFLDSTWSSTTGLDPPAAAYPASVQIGAAHQLWSSSGWSPWSCY